MKNLIALIDEEVAKQGITAKEMAGRMCIPEGTLSRMRYGTIKDIDVETLVKMQEGVADDPGLQRKILASYLQDKAAGPAGKHLYNVLNDIVHPKKGYLQEVPSPEERFFPEKDEYTPLADKARELKLPKPTIQIFVKLMNMLKTSPQLRGILKGLSAS